MNSSLKLVLKTLFTEYNKNVMSVIEAATKEPELLSRMRIENGILKLDDMAIALMDNDLLYCVQTAKDKVDKVEGKDLSTNDFTDEYKTILDDIDSIITTKVSEEISDVISTAPSSLDTLKKLADALNNDADFATTVTNMIAAKVDKEEGKGLSTNDFTNEHKTLLESLSMNNFKYVDKTSLISFSTSIDRTWTTKLDLCEALKNVNFCINITINTECSYASFGVLPEICRPKNNISCNMMSNNGVPCYVYIDANGSFGVRVIGTTNKLKSSDGVRYYLSYNTL